MSDLNDDAIWTLAVDVLSARALVWAASVGRDAELSREAHLFFFDRYLRLANAHRRRGHIGRADRLQRKAEEHLRDAGGDGAALRSRDGHAAPEVLRHNRCGRSRSVR